MTLGRSVLWYLVTLHVLLGLGVAFLLWPHRASWIPIFEATLVLSLVVAYYIFRGLKIPKEIVKVGKEWITTGDLAHHFEPTGLTDIDGLTRLYNAMMTKLREEQLRQEEQDMFLHRVLEASPSGIITTDHEGLICHTNPAAARLLDTSIEELQGRRMSELDNPIARELSILPVNGAQILGQWGRRRLKCSHSQFVDQGSSRDFYVIEDLTYELWDVEKQAYDSLIRNLSHEVNNTVGAANSILHSTLAYQGQLHADDQEVFETAIRVAVERMSNLNTFMRRYADVVRVPPPSRQPTDLVDLLERVVERSKAFCRGREVTISLDVASSPPGRIAFDAVQMEQVFDAVLQNAVEALDGTGTVQITVGRQGKRVSVSIEDTGSGLTREAEKNLWTPFFSTKKDGQGVGLTLARQILVLHGFDFSLESHPGERTRFLIVFDS